MTANSDENVAASDALQAALKLAAAEPSPKAFPWPAWGGLTWRVVTPRSGAPAPRCTYFVIIRLRRNDEHPFVTLRSGRFIGDSELVIRGAQPLREFLPPCDPVGAAHIELVENERGRLGSIIVGILECPNPFTAHRVAQTVFNSVAVAAGIQYGIPLRWNSMLISRESIDGEGERHEIVSLVGYPDIPVNLNLNLPASLARLFSNYVEGLRSNSPFYAFLCFFALAEFMMTKLQGRLRRHSVTRPIEYLDLKGTLTATDLGRVSPYYVGWTYRRLLDSTRNARNAIAHFLVERSSRPFNVAAEDTAIFARDALKVACRNLLSMVEINYQRFKAAGSTDEELLEIFERS